MSVVNKFNIFNGFASNFISDIKLFYIPNKNEALFVTITDKVFHYNYNELSTVHELSDKRVTKFASSIYGVFRPHYIALTGDGCVYSWGYNRYGQLGNHTDTSGWFSKPKLVANLIDYHVIDICCGKTHSLILAQSGHLFSFGDNSYGQCGTAIGVKYHMIPTKVNFLMATNVISIACGYCHSVALTENGKVFVWGCNSGGQLGIGGKTNQLIPVQLCVPPIIQVICGPNYTIMLSIDGNIYFCGSITARLFERFSASKISCYTKFIGIAASIHSQLIVAMSVCGRAFIFGKCRNEMISELKQTDFRSIDETYASCEQITYRTTEFNLLITFDRLDYVLRRNQQNEVYLGENKANNKKILANRIQLETVTTVFEECMVENNEDTVRSEKPLLTHNKYANLFTEISAIGIGGFSTVFKAQHNRRNKLYAIKKIGFAAEKLDTVSNELTILAKLRSKFVVKCVDSWIEHNYYIGSFDCDHSLQTNISSCNQLYNLSLPLLLHIQMELCPMTLKQAMIEIRKFKTSRNTLSLAGYYVASELMREILECVQYLHSQNPVVIHRDLKPENILIANFVNNKRFVKLADFGLSTFHEFADQSHSKYSGTKNYRAPEVNITSKYTAKADIFSLGVIMQELFCIDFTREYSELPCDHIRSELLLAPKYAHTLVNVQKLQSLVPNQRPNCCEILNEKNQWSVSVDEILDDECVKSIVTNNAANSLYTLDEHFVEFFIDHKYKDAFYC